jgi:hypothetical protein
MKDMRMVLVPREWVRSVSLGVVENREWTMRNMTTNRSSFSKDFKLAIDTAYETGGDQSETLSNLVFKLIIYLEQ